MNVMKIIAETLVNAGDYFSPEKKRCMLFRHQSVQDETQYNAIKISNNLLKMW
jgi:hypothetical protein